MPNEENDTNAKTKSNKTNTTDGPPAPAAAAAAAAAAASAASAAAGGGLEKERVHDRSTLSQDSSVDDNNVGLEEDERRKAKKNREKREKKKAPSTPTPSPTSTMPQLFDWRGGPTSTWFTVPPTPTLPINLDLLNFESKTALRRNKLQEAEEGYRRCIKLKPDDGRGYLGLSKVLQRRGKMESAGRALRDGIKKVGEDNVYLTHALGTWEEKVGHLAEAEKLYLKGTRVCPSDAASWVSLAQLRTRKLGASVTVGRMCFQQCEVEMLASGRNSTYLYTAWGGMEWREKGDKSLARTCFRKALEYDGKCSAAWLQLGCLESEMGDVDRARECFEECLRNEPRNSRVLQAYAILEAKKGTSKRKAVDLFERALKANKRDAGALQAYALYVAELGDVDGGKEANEEGYGGLKTSRPGLAGLGG
eukprot:CAMPEP_0118642766 /NCGR_PEP_ID=MMETSP0785-20121206/6009_1 /TAXON_ID=91992 /ORGANISM="Bolidomonas pacifica, Strain CCMP 1866" /LENGTH=420 /DNA_ID=CAMNT_0006534337 /DNA_START=340 /DNA_END=1597 /DNA_ORIENTATION=+